MARWDGWSAIIQATQCAVEEICADVQRYMTFTEESHALLTWGAAPHGRSRSAQELVAQESRVRVQPRGRAKPENRPPGRSPVEGVC